MKGLAPRAAEGSEKMAGARRIEDLPPTQGDHTGCLAASRGSPLQEMGFQ